MLEAFYELTGVPAVLNTSLNGPGEPIVCSGNEAYDLFISTKIDVLVVREHPVSGGPAGSSACS
jgi:carbamoyltransferase